MCQCYSKFGWYVVNIRLPSQLIFSYRIQAFNTSPDDLSPLISELPIAGQTFFGSEMDQLCQVFHTHESGQKVVVIWGFGGLGKTRLALQYVKTNQFRYSAVLWVNAATFERAVESVSQAAKNIKYRDESISQPTGGEKDIQIVHQWLLRSNAKDNWLLVIDSVDDVESFECRKLIPQCHCGSIIITSTLSHIDKNLDCQGIELGSIDVTAGVDMLLSKSRSKHNSNSRMRDLPAQR